MTRSVWIATAFTLARVPLAARIDLIPDEAYYWTWSRRLATGYYDHPPLVAWLIRASTSLFGLSPLAVRVPALLSGFVITVALAFTARELAPAGRKDTAALATALLASVMLPMHGASVIVTPDSPAAAAWALALAGMAWMVARHSALGWYVAGLGLGLAMLAKYPAGLMGLSMALFALHDRETRAWLRTPHPWLASLLALAVFSPVVLWNAHHGWISFAYQIHHGTAGRGGGVRGFSEYLGEQLLAMLTPMLVAPLVVHLAKGGHAASVSGDRLLGWSVIPTLVVFGLASLGSHPEMNWPALSYLGAAVIAGLAFSRFAAHRAGGGQSSADKLGPARIEPRDRLAGNCWKIAVVTGGVVSVLVSVVAASATLSRPIARLSDEFHSWRARAEAAREIAGNRPILAESYQFASEVAFYGGGLDGVTVASAPGERLSMFDFWNMPVIAPGGDAVYLAVAGYGPPRPWVDAFERVEALTTSPELRLSVTQLEGFRGWPPFLATRLPLGTREPR